MGFFETYRKEIAVVLIVATLIGVLITVGNVITGNAIREQQFQEEYAVWLSENCECTAREALKCKEGYELYEERRLCGKEVTVCPDKTIFNFGKSCEIKTEITSVLLGCSEYVCGGDVIALNNETNKWEPVIKTD
jgi:hypothetical protein